MPDTLVILNVYHDPVSANLDRSKLQASGVACYLFDEHIINVNPFYSQAVGGIKLKVHRNQLPDAIQVLNSTYDSEQLNYSNYFESFSNHDLGEVIYKKDKWSEKEVKLAEQILAERDILFSVDDKIDMHQLRLEEIRKPEKSSKSWMFFGYLGAVLGGVIGIIVGSLLYFPKKNDPYKTTYNVFDEKTRKHGIRMIIIGALIFLIFIARSLQLF